MRRGARAAVALLVTTAMVLPVTAAGGGGTPRTTAVSVAPNGKTATNKSRSLGSLDASISDTGRYVAFESYATNLAKKDTNREADIFWRDLKKGVTHRMNKSTRNRQANSSSFGASISGDGRLVVFASPADNLVRGDTNVTPCADNAEECESEPATDVFLRNVRKRTTRRVSVSSSERQGNDSSSIAAISGNGRYVVFESQATNLVKGDKGGHGDVFVRDLKRGRTTLVSRSSAGVQGNGECLFAEISDSGRHVVFSSDASNLVPGDTNDIEDLFVRDRKTGRTTRVNVSTAGAQSDAVVNVVRISGNGRYVIFATAATTLVPGDTNKPADEDAREQGIDVFLRDLRAGTTTRVSVTSTGAQIAADSIGPGISDDGRTLVFDSEGEDVVPGGDANDLSDVFVRERDDPGSVRRVSVSTGGTQGDSYSVQPALSGNGRYAAFESDAANLVARDDNGMSDIFRRGPL